jgi:hypothetical protein
MMKQEEEMEMKGRKRHLAGVGMEEMLEEPLLEDVGGALGQVAPPLLVGLTVERIALALAAPAILGRVDRGGESLGTLLQQGQVAR